MGGKEAWLRVVGAAVVRVRAMGEQEVVGLGVVGLGVVGLGVV
ncbi:hypothetical protein SAMN05192548_10633, partial [Paraburkholderia terricola]